MAIHPDVLSTIGRTPLIKLNRIAAGIDASAHLIMNITMLSNGICISVTITERAAGGGPALRTRAALLQISGLGERRLQRLLPFLPASPFPLSMSRTLTIG